MPKAPHILICDDQAVLHETLSLYLKAEGFTWSSAYDGEEALEKAHAEQPDLILLDIMMPKMSGTDVCKQIRKTSSVPIIMLTAKGDDMDKILGLEYGADDYMTKPFNILEVKARIKAIMRRVSRSAPQKQEKSDEISAGGLVLNTRTLTVTKDGEVVNLTAKEFDILKLLMENPGKVFSRENLLETVWGVEYMGDLRAVDVHINRLRNKIEKDTNKPEYIMTKWKAGYYFAEQQ